MEAPSSCPPLVPVLQRATKVTIYGEPCKNRKESENSAAYETFKYLKKNYGVVIVDYSYEDMVEYKARYLEMKEKYKRLKKLHHKLKEDYGKLDQASV